MYSRSESPAPCVDLFFFNFVWGQEPKGRHPACCIACVLMGRQCCFFILFFKMCVLVGALGQAMLLREMLEARLEELPGGSREQELRRGIVGGGGEQLKRGVRGERMEEEEVEERKVLEELLFETRANLELLPKIAKERRAQRRASEQRERLAQVQGLGFRF